jgi:sensor histidine kinase YesM
MITGIVGISLAISGALFYTRTSHTLKNTYQEQMNQQLNNTISQLSEQVELIDSLYTLFSSNTFIYSALETQKQNVDYTVAIEKQMGYLLITNYLWTEKCINSVYIYTNTGNTYQYATNESIKTQKQNLEIYNRMNKQSPSLNILSLDSHPNYLYFIRNIFSYNNGQRIATMIISVDCSVWMSYLSQNLESDWHIYLHTNQWEVSSDLDASTSVQSNDYMVVSKTSTPSGMSIRVAAPKQSLNQKLNTSLQVYLTIILFIIFFILLAAIALSKVVTYPITRMIQHSNRISQRHYEEPISQKETFEEFQSLTDALNHMLDEIHAYHADQLEKQILLKNAEIQALHAQMNPHFLFNTLNTLAWKAQMSDNPDLYQMVISLGELLKSNIVLKSSSLIPLEDELKYTRFYIYLQKMRFEDKISVSFEIAPELQGIQVPYFCIQSLVENSFAHGLEMKKGNGTLYISVQKQENFALFCIQDDGIGFQTLPNFQETPVSPDGSHPHVGLRNLDRRLLLLYGEESRLHIFSIPDVQTCVTFKIPIRKETNE